MIFPNQCLKIRLRFEYSIGVKSNNIFEGILINLTKYLFAIYLTADSSENVKKAYILDILEKRFDKLKI